MSNYSERINGLELHLAVNDMTDAVGKGKELFLGATAAAVLLLVAIHLHLGAHHVAVGHPFADLTPELFLAVREVDAFVVDEHILDGRHLQQLARHHLYIYGGLVLTAVDPYHTLVLFEIVVVDMQQRLHVEVAHLHHATALGIAEQVTDGVALLVQAGVELVFLPHLAVVSIVGDIRGRIIGVVVIFTIVQTVAHAADLLLTLALLDERLPDIVELTLGKSKGLAVLGAVDGDNSLLYKGRQRDTAGHQRHLVAVIGVEDATVTVDVEVEESFGMVAARHVDARHAGAEQHGQGTQVVALGTVVTNVGSFLVGNEIAIGLAQRKHIGIGGNTGNEHDGRLVELVHEVLQIAGEDGGLVVFQLLAEHLRAIDARLHTALLQGCGHLRPQAAKLLFQYGRLYAIVARHGLEVLMAQSGILDTGHQAHNLVALLADDVLVLATVGDEQLLEGLGERLGVVVEQLGGIVAVVTGELVRILSLRQTGHTNGTSGLQQQFGVLQRCLDACSVGVVNHDYLVGETHDEIDLVVGEGGSAAADDVADTIAGKRQDIELTFYEVGETCLGNVLLSLVEPVEVVPLGKQRGFSGVDILAGILPGRHQTTAEAYYLATKVVEGKHHTVAENIVRTTVGDGHNTYVLQTIDVVAALHEAIHGDVACRGITDTIVCKYLYA